MLSDQILEVLNDQDNRNKQCVLRYGFYGDKCGRYCMDKKVFDKLLNTYRQKYHKCKVINLKEYYSSSIVMAVDQNKKEIYHIEKNHNVIVNDNFMFFVKDKESMSLNQFPIVDKYDYVCNVTKTRFNDVPIIISFIVETIENDEKVYGLSLSFYNKSSNKLWLISKIEETIKFILEEISLPFHTKQKEQPHKTQYQ